MTSVKDLLEIPFGRRTLQEKRLVIELGRPIPDIGATKGAVAGIRSFQKSWYDQRDWLCGCDVLSRLFCFPCLLFKPAPNKSWTATGYANFRQILVDSEKHSQTHVHMDAYKMWKTFAKSPTIEASLSKQHSLEIEIHNKKVSGNREYLKVITNAVLFLGKQELAFRSHDESEASLNRGNYRELLEYFSKFDCVFEKRLREGSSGFKGTSKDIQNDLIKAINDVLQDVIDEEVKSAPFISIQADETTDISTKTQLSIILRYVLNNGEIVERFMGFTDISRDKSAFAIASEVITVLNRYPDAATKVIIQTYDGASVMSGSLTGVQVRVREKFPLAKFIHCFAHKLNLVLRQCASSIVKVKIFFGNISAFSAFTGVSSKRKAFVKEHLGLKFPSTVVTRWGYHSRIVSALCRDYDRTINTFESLVQEANHWDATTLSEATGLLNYLTNFEFCFLIHVFKIIFDQTTILFDILQSKSMDMNYISDKIKSFIEFLDKMRHQDFEKIKMEVVSLVGDPALISGRGARRKLVEVDYKSLFYEIIDTITRAIRERFSQLDDFSFLALLDSSKFEIFAKTFPIDLMNSLSLSYGTILDVKRLQVELKFIYSDADFRKSPFHLLKYILDNNLSMAFPELSKFLKFYLTIPITTASTERSFSTLKWIKSYSHNTMSEDRLSSLARFSIEKELLKKLETLNLNELVINKFIQDKNRRLEFLYK